MEEWNFISRLLVGFVGAVFFLSFIVNLKREIVETLSEDNKNQSSQR